MSEIEVEVEADAWLTVPGCESVVRDAAQAALSPRELGEIGERSSPEERAKAPWRPPPAAPRPPPPLAREESRSVTILLTDDAEVKQLNRDHRRQDKPTNVLSFPAHATAVGHLGDLALAYETCAREAAEQGKSLADHLRHLVVHGVLHLMGFDHGDDADADTMEAQERAVLAGLGVPDPYAARPVG